MDIIVDNISFFTIYFRGIEIIVLEVQQIRTHPFSLKSTSFVLLSHFFDFVLSSP